MKEIKIEIDKKTGLEESNKSLERTDEEKKHHVTLDIVCIQRMGIQEAELPRAHHTALEHVIIQRISIEASFTSPLRVF